MTGLESAIQGLKQALDTPRRHHMWRWLVRHRMSAVKDALAPETTRGGDAWLAGRELALHRERAALVQRLTDMGPVVLECPDTELVYRDMSKLVTSLERYRQRLNDLVYDSVSLELGGSE